MRWTQPDSIIPNTYDPQSYDRYSYVRNNPVNRVDPSGHLDTCGAASGFNKQCERDNYWTLDQYKNLIASEYGVLLVDTGSSHGNGTGPKAWDFDSAKQVYLALGIIDDKLNGQLKPKIKGSTFTLNGYDTDHYHGNTGTKYIDFETGGSFPSPYINIFHEVGHLIDANSEGGNHFSNALTHYNHTWIAQDGKINLIALLNPDVSDPYWTTGQDALQGTNYSGTTPDEQWADTFANYVAGNINMVEDIGNDMYNFTSPLF
jgi:hypothetical protein